MKLYSPDEMTDERPDERPEVLVDVFERDGDIMIELVSRDGDHLAYVGWIDIDGFHSMSECKELTEDQGYSVPFECDSRGTIKCHQGERNE